MQLSFPTTSVASVVRLPTAALAAALKAHQAGRWQSFFPGLRQALAGLADWRPLSLLAKHNKESCQVALPFQSKALHEQLGAPFLGAMHGAQTAAKRRVQAECTNYVGSYVPMCGVARASKWMPRAACVSTFNNQRVQACQAHSRGRCGPRLHCTASLPPLLSGLGSSCGRRRRR